MLQLITSYVSQLSCVHPFANCVVTVILKLQFPSLTAAPNFLQSMNAQPLFKQGEPSENVAILLECIQFADTNSLDIDKDDKGQNWGHYQFTAGGISLLSSLTTWQDVGSVATAFKLVAAALKTCQEVQLLCACTGKPTSGGYLSDIYLEQILNRLNDCWVSAGGVSLYLL